MQGWVGCGTGVEWDRRVETKRRRAQTEHKGGQPTASLVSHLLCWKPTLPNNCLLVKNLSVVCRQLTWEPPEEIHEPYVWGVGICMVNKFPGGFLCPLSFRTTDRENMLFSLVRIPNKYLSQMAPLSHIFPCKGVKINTFSLKIWELSAERYFYWVHTMSKAWSTQPKTPDKALLQWTGQSKVDWWSKSLMET